MHFFVLKIFLGFLFLYVAAAFGVEKTCDMAIGGAGSVENLNANIIAPTRAFLLVVGCGRSGTTYMSEVLSASGFDIKHEKMGQHGTVSWLTTPAEADWAPWGPLSKDYQFDHILHQVRDPIKVIQSVYNVPPRATWEWISIFIPEIKPEDSKLTKSAKYWYYWNLIAEARAEFTYRIEDFNANYQIVGERIGIVFDKNVLKSISKKTKSQKRRGHRQIAWNTLKEELDEELYAKVRNLALHYGYVPPSE